MSYAFPPSLQPLRDHIAGLGADVTAFKSDRQAAFIAQQLIGSFVKFPPQGSDMASTLFLIQKAIPGQKPKPARAAWQQSATIRTKNEPKKGKKSNADPQRTFNGRSTGVAGHRAKLREMFQPGTFADGIHIFCDGACEPNPGVGGWGVVAYRDGVEIASASGGDAQTTNNQMELTGILNAIEKAIQLSGNSGQLTIWCDSQYCVQGCNEWRHGWKAKGWNRASSSAKPENRILMNADLWKAIDDAISRFQAGTLNIRWVKGHIGVAGNERADKLAEQGRQAVINGELSILDEADELDARYREIMGAA